MCHNALSALPYIRDSHHHHRTIATPSTHYVRTHHSSAPLLHHHSSPLTTFTSTRNVSHPLIATHHFHPYCPTSTHRHSPRPPVMSHIHHPLLIKAGDGVWRSYNDSSVVPMDSTRVGGPGAYLLFYHRVGAKHITHNSTRDAAHHTELAVDRVMQRTTQSSL
jgi:hypothetical protein